MKTNPKIGDLVAYVPEKGGTVPSYISPCGKVVEISLSATELPPANGFSAKVDFDHGLPPPSDELKYMRIFWCRLSNLRTIDEKMFNLLRAMEALGVTPELQDD